MPKLGKQTDEQLRSSYETSSTFRSQLDFLERSGGNVRRTDEKLGRILQEAEGRGLDFSDFEAETKFDSSDAGSFRSQTKASDDLSGKDTTKKATKARVGRQLDQARIEGEVKETEEFAADIDEKFGEAQAIMDEILASPVFSPKFLADSRSQMASQIKQAEESRLGRVGASLGMRGLGPGSPVAAALASQAAEESDQFLVDQLRQQGMQTEQIEQASQLMEVQQQSALAQARVGARNAALQHDRGRLDAVNAEVDGMFQAMQQQRELRQIMAEQERNAGSVGFADYLDMGNSVAGAVANFFPTPKANVPLLGKGGGAPGATKTPTGSGVQSPSTGYGTQPKAPTY